MNNPLSLSYQSLPNTTSHLITHEVSDGGLATSTHRLAANTGADVSAGRSKLFGPNAKPIHLPKLNSFLGGLGPPNFSPWTEIFTEQELQEYQRGNHRKFPILHIIPLGLSLNDLKANRLKRELLPGFENDFWKFLVEVCVLTAGSPDGKYMTVDIFRAYTQAILTLYSGHQASVVAQVMNWTGQGSLALTVIFCLTLTLLYKCRSTQERDRTNPLLDVYCLMDISEHSPKRSQLGKKDLESVLLAFLSRSYTSLSRNLPLIH